MMPIYYLLALILLVSTTANAQVYKCRSADQKIIYSDSPCTSGHVQVLTNIVTINPPASSNHDTSTVMQQLDTAVKSAISAGDLHRAQALATTPEHKTWVAAALKEHASQPEKSEAVLKAELASSTACEKAKKNLEAEAASAFSSTEMLSARKSLMYAACGVVEPVVMQQQIQQQSGYLYGYGYPYRFRHDRRPGPQHNKPADPPDKTRSNMTYHPDVQIGNRSIKSNIATPASRRGNRTE